MKEEYDKVTRSLELKRYSSIVSIIELEFHVIVIVDFAYLFWFLCKFPRSQYFDSDFIDRIISKIIEGMDQI